jgi:putative Mg2+ transporter-C (MgtC) family protein
MSGFLLGELDLLLRLLAGMAAGIVVGWERTKKQRAAGIRTFGLVGLGTAAAATISAPRTSLTPPAASFREF